MIRAGRQVGVSVNVLSIDWALVTVNRTVHRCHYTVLFIVRYWHTVYIHYTLHTIRYYIVRYGTVGAVCPTLLTATIPYWIAADTTHHCALPWARREGRCSAGVDSRPGLSSRHVVQPLTTKSARPTGARVLNTRSLPAAAPPDNVPATCHSKGGRGGIRN
jgi:hypothetical protein